MALLGLVTIEGQHQPLDVVVVVVVLIPQSQRIAPNPVRLDGESQKVCLPGSGLPPG